MDLFYNNEVGSICDYNWNDDDAIVLCRQMGFVDGAAYELSEDERGSDIIWLVEPSCRGHEEAIWNCPTYAWNVPSAYCNFRSLSVGVKCNTEGNVFTA